MSTPVGKLIGRYKIRSLVGAGGMGEVYLAEDTQLERDVALKILPSHLASDEQRMRRFVQEARAASSLNHPNIITIHEVGQFDSTNFIATEYIDGLTLRQIMAKRVTLREIFDISIQIASALSAAHDAGIVHRDIKPENVMLRRDGYVKVLDFGLAKLTEKVYTGKASDPEAPTKPNINTDPGVVMGTSYYMSPEQARGLAIDIRTDIWSLGCVVYEMITGHTPFKGSTPSDIIAAILEKEPLPLSRYMKDVPGELDRIVGKALEKEKEERYQTVKDLLVDIRRLRRRLEVEAELERSVQPDVTDKSSTDKSGTQTSEAGRGSTSETVKTDLHHMGSSAEYVVGEIKQHKKGLLLVLLALLVLGAGAVYYQWKRATTIDSVAIMPFTSAGDDPVLEDLSDGVTESVRNGLSQMSGLRVVPRSTVFRYKGQIVEPEKIGSALGVRSVLTGKILKRGDTLIVQVELIDVSYDAQVWGKRIEQKQSDIMGGSATMTMREEISKQILESVRSKFPGGSAPGQANRQE
ncbi:MAG TPA: serine/threonine-protein kinase [Pyrinomonadaceae bacterium]|jgi:serine/threonine protein kinase